MKIHIAVKSSGSRYAGVNQTLELVKEKHHAEKINIAVSKLI